MDERPTTLTEAKAAFVEAGGNLLHKAVNDRLASAERRAQQDAVAQTAPKNAHIAKYIVTVLGWLAVGFVALVMVVGVALALFILPAAELTSVAKGLATITPDPLIVNLTSAALLLAVLVLPFLKYAYADALPASKPQSTLTRGVVAFLRWLGVGSERLPLFAEFTNLETNYLAVSRALSLTKAAIVGTSVVGRLATLFETYGALPAGEAWVTMLRELTGTELFSIVISGFVLWAILAILDVFVLFVYVSFKNTAGKLDLGNAEAASGVSFEVLREQYQVEILNDMTMQLNAKRRQPTLLNTNENTLSSS